MASAAITYGLQMLDRVLALPPWKLRKKVAKLDYALIKVRLQRVQRNQL